MNAEDYDVSLDLGYRGFVISVITNEDGSNTDLSDSNIHRPENDKFPDTFLIYGSKNQIIYLIGLKLLLV